MIPLLSRPAAHLASTLLLLLGACSREAAATAGDPLAGLTLDAGKHWVADEHTRRSVAAMSEAVRRVAGQTDAKSTTALGDELQRLLQQLIAGCTMTGPAHDALHVYLSALIERVGLMRGSDAAAARKAREDVSVILARFADYFT